MNNFQNHFDPDEIEDWLNWEVQQTDQLLKHGRLYHLSRLLSRVHFATKLVMRNITVRKYRFNIFSIRNPSIQL